MEALSRLKNTFVEYLSPKRRRTIGPTPSTPSNDTKVQYLSLSEPQDRRTWKTSPVHTSFASRTGNPRKRRREDEEDDYEDFDVAPGDSIYQGGFSVNGIMSSKRPHLENHVAMEELEEQDVDSIKHEESDQEIDEESEGEGHYDYDLNYEDMENVEEGDEVKFEDVEEEEPISGIEEESTSGVEEEPAEPEISPDAKVEEYLARQAELELRKESIAKARKAGDWHPDELFLFERLTLRSFEELIPQSWQIDFRTLPEILFTRDDDDKSFINYNSQPSIHGVKALQALLSLGVRVRDKIIVGLPTERLIEQDIKRYIKWSEKDGGFHKKRFLPVITLVKARPNQSVDSINKSITNQMTFLAEKHRDYLAVPGHTERDGEIDTYRRPPPLLYGIIIARTITIFVTLDSANPNAKVRHLQHFDFKDKDMDVWNGFAIAIMVICSRNNVMSISDELETDDAPQSDVDA